MARWRSSSGETYELPKLTLAMSEATDRVSSARAARERAELEWRFLSDVLPDGALAPEVDGETVDTCDVVALEVCYQGVVAAYTLPMHEARARAAREQLDLVRQPLEAVSKMAPVVSMMGGAAPAARR